MSRIPKLKVLVIVTFDQIVFFLLFTNSRRTRVIIWYKDRILVIKSRMGDGKWTVPGGGLKKGELVKRGAIREVKEEVGISLDEHSLIDHGERLFKDKLIKFKLCLVEVKLENKPDVTLQRFEVSDFAWLKPSELNKGNTNKELLRNLEHLLQ